MSAQSEKNINKFTMSVNTPVIPYPANLFFDEKELHRFILKCQEKAQKKGDSQIISFSQKIDIIDPLVVLEAIAQPDQLHFYWETPSKDEAILGYGVTKCLTLDSCHRFAKSQKFIQSCLNNTIRIGNLSVPGSGPYLFCSFTFFDSRQYQDSPFPTATIFLPRVQIVKKKDSCVLLINLSIETDTSLQSLLKQIIHQIQIILLSCQQINRKPENHSIKLTREVKIYPSYSFTSSVASALQSIQSNQFSKIVLAHALDVVSPVSFKIAESLNNLRQRHPDCYIFSTSNGKGATFIGASPERLISITNQQLVTDALAGSAPRGKTSDEDTMLANKLLNSEKERREHQAVSDFITKRLEQLGLTPQKSPLKLLQLSNIQHLWTPIYAKLPNYMHPLEIVSKLHPTPAVAGVPTEIACEQIRRYETFDRSLYAAPLGWIDYQGNSEFIVGIRSALIQGNHARLYAGAGIVAGSDPNKELAEIQLKFQALLKALL